MERCRCGDEAGEQCWSLRHWLAANRIARRINLSGRPDYHVTSYVETVVPWRWLARLAAAPDTRRVSRRERIGLLRRRWTLTRGRR